jgi:hypothetical protein
MHRYSLSSLIDDGEFLRAAVRDVNVAKLGFHIPTCGYERHVSLMENWQHNPKIHLAQSE